MAGVFHLQARGIETPQQDPQRLQHLLGQAGAHLVLLLAALLHQRPQARVAGTAFKQAIWPEQHLQRRQHRSPIDRRHRLQREGEMAAGFTPRRIHQPQGHPVPEQANRVLAFLEQPLQPLLWRCLPAAPAIGALGERVKGRAQEQLLHQ